MQTITNLYQERTYRKTIDNKRFVLFSVRYFETDLWIAINRKSYKIEIKDYIFKRILFYRKQIEDFAKEENEFYGSLIPLQIEGNKPKIVSEMMKASEKAGIGPMAAVAGAFSQLIGNDVLHKFHIDEIIIENGGDIFLKIIKPVTISVFAGKSVFSEKIEITITKEQTPVGICTSAGNVGYSLSFGKADAVMIACKNTMLADAYATKFGNLVKIKSDVNKVIKRINKIDEILSALIIKDDIIALCGIFDYKM